MMPDSCQTGSPCFLHCSLTLTPLPLLLGISDLTCLDMQIGESSINYMSRVRGISQRMHGITMEHIIPLFAIASLDHDRYPCVKSRYFAVEAALVNWHLLEFSGLFSSENTRQRALGIPSAPLSTTVANRVSNTPTQPPPTVRPSPRFAQTPAQTSAVPYTPPRGVPWDCIAVMVRAQRQILSRMSL